MESFKDLVFELMISLPEKFCSFVITMTSVWKSRNEYIWNNKEETKIGIIQRADTVLSEWKAVQVVSTNMNVAINSSSSG